LEGLGHLFSSDVAALSESPDAQDAILCVLAGADFLKSFAKPPAAKQKNRALHEGWIWVPTPPMLLERYKGSLLGLACGDAVGTSVEFRPRGSFPPVTDMAGGGPFRLAPGQWTDDTSMALCLAQSLIESKGFDARDQMNRYLRWWRTGYLSSTGRCFDIGNTTRAALANFEATGEPFSGSTAPDTAGNGSLMRLAPVVLYFFPDAERVTQFSAESSRTTHAASEAVECCVLLGHMIAVALSGAPKEVILAAQGVALQNSTVISLQRGDYSTKPTEKIRGSGYCIESLEAALWCFQHTDGFEAAVLRAVNLGDDADTTAAIVGQLAGAFYGVQGIPQHWLERLHMRKEIETLAARLYEALPKCDCAKPHVAPALPEE
jgi:ADP-ribosyl-[dinitrogen reductase] hydrolase